MLILSSHVMQNLARDIGVTPKGKARGMATRVRAAIILIIELIRIEKEKVCGGGSAILLYVHCYRLQAANALKNETQTKGVNQSKMIIVCKMFVLSKEHLQK